MYSKAAQTSNVKPKKVKAKGKAWYVKKLKVVFSQVIRARDGKCLRCGKTETLQCSHIAPVGTHRNAQFDEFNAITLCYKCHIYFWHKHPIKASEWLKETFPSLWQHGNEIKQETITMRLPDYIELYEQLKIRLKVLHEIT